jgi:hypothetical protein
VSAVEKARRRGEVVSEKRGVGGLFNAGHRRGGHGLSFIPPCVNPASRCGLAA